MAAEQKMETNEKSDEMISKAKAMEAVIQAAKERAETDREGAMMGRAMFLIAIIKGETR